MVEDSVVAGWLAGSEHLLLIAWSDNRAEFGTGKYRLRGTVLVHVTENDAVPILRTEVLAE